MPEETEKAATLEPKPPPHPRDLSSEYHKAHKQLMLWATILLIWELIGVDLSKAKDAGGNIGPIVTALKSPQAVPWALTGLVVYFLFKCSVEWAQCHPDRRKIRFARIDFISAWVVAVAAIALYTGQAISRIQVADFFADQSRSIPLVVGATIAMFSMIFVFPFEGKFDPRRIVVMVVLIAVDIFIYRVLLPTIGLPLPHWRLVLIGFGSVSIPCMIGILTYTLYPRRRLPKK